MRFKPVDRHWVEQYSQSEWLEANEASSTSLGAALKDKRVAGFHGYFHAMFLETGPQRANTRGLSTFRQQMY